MTLGFCVILAVASVASYEGGQRSGINQGMVECKLKPTECDKQFKIYQTEQELLKLKNEK